MMSWKIEGIIRFCNNTLSEQSFHQYDQSILHQSRSCVVKNADDLSEYDHVQS